jgi:hypothetical protein
MKRRAELLCEYRTGSWSQEVPSAQEQIHCNMPSKNIHRHFSIAKRLASVASHCFFLKVRITEEQQIRQTYMSNIKQSTNLSNSKWTSHNIAFYCDKQEDKELSTAIYKKKVLKDGDRVP